MKFPHLFAVALTLDMAFQAKFISSHALREAQSCATVEKGLALIRELTFSRPQVTLDDDNVVPDRGIITLQLPGRPITILLEAEESLKDKTHTLRFCRVEVKNHIRGDHLIEAKFDEGSTMIGWWPEPQQKDVIERFILFLDNFIESATPVHPTSLHQLRALALTLRSPTP